MKHRTLVLAVLLAVASIVGCSKGNGTFSSSNGPVDLTGAWEGSVADTPASNANDPAAQLGKMFSSMAKSKLDINKDGSFKLTVFVISIEGHYSIDGNTLTLNPEKLMGKTESELKQLQGQSPMKGNLDDSFKPMSGTISKDGTEISLKMDHGNASSPSGGLSQPFVFHRAKPEASRASTVSDTEQPLVGKWSGKMDLSSMQPKDENQKQGMALAKSMLGDTSLELRKDNTFVMHMGMDVEGKWKLNGKVLTLDMGAMSFGKPTTATVSSDGKSISMDNMGGKGSLTFTKD